MVIRVADEIREIIKAKNDRLFLGFTAHSVIDRFYIKNYAKCHRFGHYRAECNSKPCCGFCQIEDHASEQCPLRDDDGNDTTKFKCINCQESGKKANGHSSHWRKCPTYLEIQKKMKMNIPYYSKNSQ